MKQVYLVACGEYSDYRVEAVYEDRELAEKHREALAGLGGWSYSDPRVQTMEISTTVPEMNPDRWIVTLELATGQVLFMARQEDNAPFPDHVASRAKMIPSGWIPVPAFITLVDGIHPRDGAIKIANERRLRWKAEKAIELLNEEPKEEEE